MGIYEPKPIDTSQVRLDPALQDLLEELSRNNHDHWAQQRVDQGWRYGPTRNDELKQHPDLVPYDQLNDQEKNYDRTSVLETLKAIVALGYEIKRK